MNKHNTFFLFLLPTAFFFFHVLNAQEVPVFDYRVDADGCAQISVASTSDHYYVLYGKGPASGAPERAIAIAKGINGTTTLRTPLAAQPRSHYKILEHPLTKPADTDADGTDDLTELANMPAQSPLNAAPPIDTSHGVACLPDRAAFKRFGVIEDQSGQNLESIKFYIRYRDAPQPKLYFINSRNYVLHTQFAAAIGYFNDGTLMTGAIIFHPSVKAANGTLGVYRFAFQPNNDFSIAYVQKALDLLSSNMPFLKNNLCYYPLLPFGVPKYLEEQAQYDSARICVLLEQDIYADVDYLAMNGAEGYGLLRHMAPGETPGTRDVVIYESLPNELPRVGGIITTVMQTPLSHVNLRAIQDQLPNAFIRQAVQQPEISSLIGKYVHYKVERSGFLLEEATKAAVDAHYARIRPAKGQVPIRDLSVTEIRPLDEIHFEQSNAFGVKCANVATMRRFGFPEGTIPDGFGIPFYFYDAFMRFNGFYEQAKTMLADPDFQADPMVQANRLAAFRTTIKNAPMPDWMMTALGQMQAAFPAGSSIRCRSSTNNEDLPGFSGAGLYDSKTQHPNEGHIAKSIKQVYASMWNFRAFDEREFYRVDHFTAAMGVLVHPNHENERANGVGVSTDPLYRTEGTYYLNTQLGEDLVTNPNALSIPEEILLDAVWIVGSGFYVINSSNQIPHDSLLMDREYLTQMRSFLSTIHEKFQVLYKAENKSGFAMEIEYKIDADGQLVIKQARPWASFWAGDTLRTDTTLQKLGLHAYPNPFREVVHLTCDCSTEMTIAIANMAGQKLMETTVDFRRSGRQISLGAFPAGVYFLSTFDQDGRRYATVKLVKMH